MSVLKGGGATAWHLGESHRVNRMLTCPSSISLASSFLSFSTAFFLFCLLPEAWPPHPNPRGFCCYLSGSTSPPLPLVRPTSIISSLPFILLHKGHYFCCCFVFVFVFLKALSSSTSTVYKLANWFLDPKSTLVRWITFCLFNIHVSQM